MLQLQTPRTFARVRVCSRHVLFIQRRAKTRANEVQTIDHARKVSFGRLIYIRRKREAASDAMLDKPISEMDRPAGRRRFSPPKSGR